MNTYTISFRVANQRITASEYIIPVSDTKQFLRAAFSFDESWENLSPMGVFIGVRSGMNVSVGKGAHAVYTVPLEADKSCFFPAEVLSSEYSVLLVGAIGYSLDGGSRLTTNTCGIRQEPSCFYTHATPNPPAPDLYAEMLNNTQFARAIADELSANAANGVYNGKDGRDGLDGTDGTDGLTPHISTNGTWCIGSTDTGVRAEGRDGSPGPSGMIPTHDLNNLLSAHLLPANHMGRISIISPCLFSFAPGVEGYDNEWGLTIHMSVYAQTVTFSPSVTWGLGIAPTFPPGSTTICRFYYVGETLCGEWVTV